MGNNLTKSKGECNHQPEADQQMDNKGYCVEYENT